MVGLQGLRPCCGGFDMVWILPNIEWKGVHLQTLWSFASRLPKYRENSRRADVCPTMLIHGNGVRRVTIPSQIRYVDYYADVLDHHQATGPPMIRRSKALLHQIHVRTVPHFDFDGGA
jgi:hypothetical protein